MIFLYSLLTYLIAPFILFYLLKRSKKNPNYKLFWNERFAFNLKNKETKPIIWLHSVSVGETRAMVKLINLINLNYPNYKILITMMTPTGRKTAEDLYKNVIIHYIPYDMPHAVIKFYKTFKPKIGLIMETEIWPNLMVYAKKYKIPVFLVNARLSTKSFNSYKNIIFFIKDILNCFTGILCQDDSTKNNFNMLGYKNKLSVVGNTKFDIFDNKEENFATNYFTHFTQNLKNKKIVIFSSTRDGEEKMIIEKISNNYDYLIVIVPRHPERFQKVEQLLIENNIKYLKRSDNIPITEDTKVFLGDSMGEMMSYYKMSDLAVIGGSFANTGGQNLIEPIFLNIPVIFGKSMYNFETIARNYLVDGCAIQVDGINECFLKIDEIFANEGMYNTLKSNCTKIINNYKGASEKIFKEISLFL